MLRRVVLSSLPFSPLRILSSLPLSLSPLCAFSHLLPVHGPWAGLSSLSLRTVKNWLSALSPLSAQKGEPCSSPLPGTES